MTNRSRSIITNLKQGLTGLHKNGKYQSHTINCSPVTIQKPRGMTELFTHGNTEAWIHEKSWQYLDAHLPEWAQTHQLN